MPKGNESTTKFKADISELKSAMQEAGRAVRMANSEFKAATSGMEDWSKNADGLSAKVKQLGSVLDAEKTKLSTLEQQYKLVAAAEGENSKGAQELIIKINNQKAAIGKVESQFTSYKQKLEDCNNGVVNFVLVGGKAVSKLQQLKKEIIQQEFELSSLKQAYAEASMEQGENSEQARQLASQIQALSTKLNANHNELLKAEQSADKFDRSLKDVKNSAGDSSEMLTAMKVAIGNLLANGIQLCIDSLKELGLNGEDAFDKFQAATGVGSEGMKEFKNEILDLYKNNYGESLEDVADAMMRVKQQTNETDPSKIKEMAKSALNLRDTFGSDLNESIRGVNNLMTHFGLSSDEAFDLFAKGSQEGLDYTDELGDNVAEYGGNFQQAGYSAQEYFQLLKNGTQGGAYNLDKVNDSINEIKNRLGDGTIEKNLSMFSTNTQNVFKLWKSGNASMKDVINSIVKDISGCTNESEALTMAQTAFGTMGEDANLKVVKSLTTVGDTFANVKGTMENVDKTRWDNTKAQLAMIGRSIQVDVAQPILNSVVPSLVKFGTWFTSNIPILLASLAALGTGFLVFNIAMNIAELTTAFGMLGMSIKGLGLILATTPLGLFSVIAGAVAGVVAYTAATSRSSSELDKNAKATNRLMSEQKELTKTMKEHAKVRKDNISSAQAEGKEAEFYANKLEELRGVEDKSAAQKATMAKYVEKLNELVPQLGLKYDSEKDSLNKSTDAIRANIAAQKDLLLAKAAQKNMESIASDIATLEIKNAEIAKQNAKNQDALTAAHKRTMAAKAAAQKVGFQQGSVEMQQYTNAVMAESKKREQYNKTNNALEKNKKKLQELNKQYEDTGNYANKKLDSADMEKQINAITEKMAAKGKEIPKAVSDGMRSGQYVIPTTVAGMQNLIKFDSMAQKAKLSGVKIPANLAKGISSGKISAENAIKALTNLKTFDNSNAVKKAKELGIKIPKNLREGIASGKMSVEQAMKVMEDSAKKGTADLAKSQKKVGKVTSKDLASGLLGGKSTVNKAGKTLGKAAKSGTSSGGSGTKKVGSKQASDYSSGVNSGKDKAKTSGKTVAKNAKTGAESVKTKKSGENFSQGFINGIGSLAEAAWEAAKSLAKKAWEGLKKGQKEGSPSKLTTQSGKYFGEGFNNGINKMIKYVVRSATNMGVQAVNSLREAQDEHSPSKITYNSGVNFTKGFVNGIVSMEKTVISTAKNLVESALTELMKLNDFNFSEVGTNAANVFSNGIADKISYTLDKMNYQNDKKLSEFDRDIANYTTKQDKNQTNYDNAKKKYDKAKSNYDKAKAKYKKADSKKEKAKYKKQMAQYKKQMAADKKQMTSYKKNVDSYKSLISGTTAAKEAYQTASQEMLSEFSDAMNDYQSQANDLINDTINGITENYQSQYDALINKQDTLISKLQSAGDLFTVSSAGIMTVNDIKQQTQNIKDYTSKLQSIKEKVSSDLFDQIASYDMDQGNAFMDRLLGMSESDLKAYSDAYDEKMKVSEELSQTLYKPDFDKLQTEYNDAMNKAFADLPAQLEALGKQAMAGFVEGMKVNTDYLDSSVKTIINGLIDQFKSQLDIHSPSKVMEKLAMYIPQGIANGITNGISYIKDATNEMIDTLGNPLGDFASGVGSAKLSVAAAGASGSTSTQNIVNNYNYVQNNTSPKALSDLEIYRKTKQQIALMKGKR